MASVNWIKIAGPYSSTWLWLRSSFRHSIGTSVHEWPRLVSYETERFRKDTVVMVEPTAFDPDTGGVRLEFMLHVTENGCEVLTDFEHQMVISH